MAEIRDPRDVLADLFPVDGPHSHELTVAAANGVAALVRFLNYATQRPSGTPYPGTLYDVIGNVQAALYGLDQTLRQTSARLAELAAGPDARQSAGLGDERWPDRRPRPTPPRPPA